MAGIIELKKVCFSAREGRIIHGVSVDFEPAKTTAIVGPSGGGKSTILKLSAGLLVPEEGDILYKNKNITNMNRFENLNFRREGAFVFQDSALWANQTLYQILDLPLKIHYPDMNKTEREKRMNEVTAQVGYRRELNIRPAMLSMGEQKLIAFARALLCRPNLMFLDEWTESLDETNADRLVSLVRQKQREGATILFVSHDMRIIWEIADNIIVIANGEMTLNTKKEDIIGDINFIGDYLKIGIVS